MADDIGVLGLRATVSGSFHRGMGEVQSAVADLVDAGIDVLSPADPRVVDAFGEFLFVASDRRRKIRMVQDRHLAAIAASHFVWLVAPSGYVGLSAAMEIGCAVERHVPVFASTPPNDLTLRQYVRVVPTVEVAIRETLVRGTQLQLPGLLLDPDNGADLAHTEVERIRTRLLTPSDEYGDDDHEVRAASRRLRGVIHGL